MSLRYLSVCSGIEAATQAWHPLGWQPVAFSEIEPFPCAVLAHHYPTVPNWGDMTRYQEWPDADVDVLCGGTPCQSFSVAGLRKGLADPRGNLMLTFGAIAARYRPRWLVWENVPGVLSSNGGRDFGTFLGMLRQLGYGFAYRVLDAQHIRTRRFPFAVPQRRRRVFVVGYLGDWRRAAAVLFDRESLSGHPAPRREAGQGTARGFECGPAGGGFTDLAPTLAARCKDGPIRNQVGAGVITSPVSNALCSRDYKGARPEADQGAPLVAQSFGGDVARTLSARHDSSPCADRGMDVVAFPAEMSGTQVASSKQLSPALSVTHTTAVAFDMRGREGGSQLEGPHDTANIRAASGGSSRSYVAAAWQVRRLTPVECERLQGFPDNFTRIPYRGKPAEACPDGPRYKALGNSWAVNCAEWIGERIAIVDAWEDAA